MSHAEPQSESRPDLLQETIVVNLGLDQFFDSLKEQGIQGIQVKWSPPAGGDEDALQLLDALL